MIAASPSDRTNKVVGIPFRAATVANANPKLPPPMTATRTGYGGGELVIIYNIVDDDEVRGNHTSFENVKADDISSPFRRVLVSNENAVDWCRQVRNTST